MIWIVGENNAYFDVISSSLQGSDVGLVLQLTEEAALAELEAVIEDDTAEKLCIITDETSTGLLDYLCEMLDLNWISVGNRLTVLILSQTADWVSALSPTCTDLSSAFGYRKALLRHFDSFSQQNTLIDFSSRGKLRLHIILLGHLIGQNGYQFNDTFRTIWREELKLTAAHEKLCSIVPMIYYARFGQLIVSILASDAPLPTVLPGFDWDDRSLASIVKEINSKINPSLMTTSPDVSTEESGVDLTQDALFDFLTSCASSDVSQFKHLFQTVEPNESNMTSMLPTVWNEFLSSSGLQPVYVFVAGPPKCGKTDFAKSVADSLKVVYIDQVSAVVSALELTEEKVALESVNSHLNGPAILAFQKELIGAIEAKLSEGKKAKDKAPSDGKIDLSAVNETVCSALSVDLRKKAVGLAFSISSTCRRRGCVWDVWDKGFISEPVELQECCHLFDEARAEGDIKTENQAPVQAIIELQADDKWLLSKYNDYLTAQQMKPKEAQAMVKTFETTLPTYFSALTAVEEQPSLQSHSKIKTFLEGRAGAIALRPVLSAALGTVVSKEEMQLNVQRALEGLQGMPIGWLNTSVETVSAPVIVSNTSPVPSRPATAPAAPGQVVDVVAEKPQTPEPEIDPSVREKLAANTDKISSFLSNTILPVLTKSVIDVMRERPEDPIMYVANFLAKQSEQNQTEALENARQRFYELLAQ